MLRRAHGCSTVVLPGQCPAPEGLQRRQVHIGLPGQGLQGGQQGLHARALRQLHVQQRHLVARFAALLVQAPELLLCLCAFPQAGAHGLEILQRQVAHRGGACRKQLACQLRGLLHAAGARHQAHLRQFFALGAVHLHQHLQLPGKGTLRVLRPQGVQNALRLLGLVLSQRQVAQRGQAHGRMAVGQQQFLQQLARQVGAVLGRPHLRAAQQFGLGTGHCGLCRRLHGRCFHGLGVCLHGCASQAGGCHQAPSAGGHGSGPVGVHAVPVHQRCQRSCSCPVAVNW